MATWSLVDTKFSVRKYPKWGQRILLCLEHQILESIQEDLRQRPEMDGTSIESLLASDPPLVK